MIAMLPAIVLSSVCFVFTTRPPRRTAKMYLLDFSIFAREHMIGVVAAADFMAIAIAGKS